MSTSTSPLNITNAPMAWRRLDVTATLFAVAVMIHNLDHLRRGPDAVSPDVFVAGTLAIVVEVGVVWLVLGRHRSAPLAAAVAGWQLAIGYLVVHFTPSRSWLSDSFPDGAPHVNVLSWFAAASETVTAAALGVAGLYALRELGGLSGVAAVGDGGRLARAARHPVLVALIVVNLVVLFTPLVAR